MVRRRGNLVGRSGNNVHGDGPSCLVVVGGGFGSAGTCKRVLAFSATLGHSDPHLLWIRTPCRCVSVFSPFHPRTAARRDRIFRESRSERRPGGGGDHPAYDLDDSNRLYLGISIPESRG